METVLKTLDILETFLNQSGEIGIAELSNLSGVNITTAYRISSDLVKRGYLKQKQKRGKYSIGIKLLEYSRVIQNNLKISEIAYPYLQKVSRLCEEYSEIAILESDSAMTIAQVETTHNLKIRNEIGERLPLHATSLGKLFLSYMNNEDRQIFYDSHSFNSCTPNTITDKNHMEQEISLIRQQGFAIDNEEYDMGIWAVAAPVYDVNQSVTAALSIAAPSVRIDGSKQKILIDLAKTSALEISRNLGYKS